MESETTRSSEQNDARAELEELRRRAAMLEARLKAEDVSSAVEQTPQAPVERAAAAPAPEAEPQLPPPPSVALAASEDHIGAITLHLSPERHDQRMGEFISLLQEKGVSAAIAAVEDTGNPHLVDDFQRVLSEYMREGMPVKKIPAPESALGRALDLALLEITLPRRAPAESGAPRDAAKDMREHIGLMEQFYRSVLSLGRDMFFSFEIANAAGTSTTSAFLAVPSSRKELFEKQILGLFPSARIKELPDDYNIFGDQAHVAASRAYLPERPIFALRSVDEMQGDPFDTILSAFSRLDREHEGAALQCVVLPADRGLGGKYRNALQSILEGTPVAEASAIRSGFGLFFHLMLKSWAADEDKRKESREQDKRTAQNDPRVKAIERKVAHPIMHANLRLVASAASAPRAEEILASLESSFDQLTDAAGGGRLRFERVRQSSLKIFTHSFAFRIFDNGRALPLSTAEVASFAHLPRSESAAAAPELRQERSAVAPAPSPSAAPGQGVLLGINRFRGVSTDVRLLSEDRLRHLYVIGQTGTGKSALLKNIVIQDIEAGNGCCFIDPHGSDVLDILSRIPAERAGDVIYFDPGDTAHPMGLNMLEYDTAHPEQKTLVVDELLGIFRKLFGAVPESMGPAFEQYFRNAALLVMEDPQSGNTLLDISRIFADESFRLMKLARCKNPTVAQFWRDIASKASGEQGLENYGPYVTNKFDVFTSNEIMRPIIAQQRSAFSFRDVMDDRKILLVNLAKGRIGDINANLLGLIIVGKFLLAALSRSGDIRDLPPFYLTIDEFQNFTTPSIATILSEARKYKLSLTVAHQFIAQLDEKIRDAVFGNVGSQVALRVGAADAEYLAKQFAPTFSAADLMHADNYHAFAHLLVAGAPADPFSLETLPFMSGDSARAADLAVRSAALYGRSRADIEADISRMHG